MLLNHKLSLESHLMVSKCLSRCHNNSLWFRFLSSILFKWWDLMASQL